VPSILTSFWRSQPVSRTFAAALRQNGPTPTFARRGASQTYLTSGPATREGRKELAPRQTEIAFSPRSIIVAYHGVERLSSPPRGAVRAPIARHNWQGWSG